jgi:hypothetical protein
VCVSDFTRDWSVCQANSSDVYELLLVAGGGAGSDFETYAPALKDMGMCAMLKHVLCNFPVCLFVVVFFFNLNSLGASGPAMTAYGSLTSLDPTHKKILICKKIFNVANAKKKIHFGPNTVCEQEGLLC